MSARLLLAARLGTAALILAGAITGALILVAVAPAAAAIRRARRGRRRPVPGLPDDGEPLEPWEYIMLAILDEDLRHADREERGAHVNTRVLAVWLWLFAWLAVDAAGVLVFNGLRGRGSRLTAVGAAFILFAAAVLANAGADLW